MGEAKRRKQLLGDAYGQPKPGRVYHNGKDVFIRYLEPGSLDWDKAQKLRESNPSFFDGETFSRNIKIDYASDENSLIGIFKFTVIQEDEGFSIYGAFLSTEGERELPKSITQRLTDNHFSWAKSRISLHSLFH